MANYSASITSSLFWLQESRTTARYISEGMSRKELCQLSRDENIFMAPSDDRKRKIANTTYDRISKLPEELIRELGFCDVAEARLIVLYSILLSDDLFHDFMIEIFKPKLIFGNTEMTANDVRIYLENKKATHESVQKISEASFYKLGQTYIKMLVEGGLINNAKEGKIIKPYIPYTLFKNLENCGGQEYLAILRGY